MLLAPPFGDCTPGGDGQPQNTYKTKLMFLLFNSCFTVFVFKSPSTRTPDGGFPEDGGWGGVVLQKPAEQLSKDILSKRKRHGKPQNAPMDTMGSNPQWPLTSPTDASHLLPTTPGRAPTPTAPSGQTNQTRTGSGTLTQLPIYIKYK